MICMWMVEEKRHVLDVVDVSVDSDYFGDLGVHNRPYGFLQVSD
jgi:hypothetical protein